MADLGKELDRDRDEAGMDGDTLVSDEYKTHKIASDINGVRERSEGGNTNQRDAVDRAKATAGREKAKAMRLKNIIEDE